MQSLVVFFALATVACASYIPLAQPPHHPAVVLDPHGRPLDTAEVINARALHLQAKALEPHAAIAVAPVAHSVVAPVAHSVVAPVAHAVVAPVAHSYVAPAAAVSHQSRVDVRSSPAVVSVHAAPLVAHAHGALAAPLLGHSALGLAGHGHYLHKRSLGHIAYSAPIAVHAPAAVSHQSRVDVVSSPAIVSHAVAAPVVAHAVAAPVAVAPAAVSHQSRVDVRTSPAVYAAAPIAHSAVYAAAAPLAHSAVYAAAAPLAHSAVYAAPAHAAGHWAHAW
ncbi:larval/pupal cuticle protein H1C-like [Zerene cesonia]|uniref:larval/pupal cuticle protein H1C-like n=1 Tax=Zerene cesonia TaxID=33412 RepID=UPI0018E55221|nr:larval/pupal cuticle protein H1C-like [Zerene cesonia]